LKSINEDTALARMQAIDQSKLHRDMAVYQKPERLKSIWQMINSIGPYVILFYGAYLALDYSFWIALPIIILLSGFLIRIFIIFHDCGHRSFFRSQKANDFWGVLTGILTFTPYHRWRASHARHHNTSGNLDRRGQGDVWLMTLNEYEQASWKERIKYRLYRNPIIMFLFGPLAITLLSNRIAGKNVARTERISVYATNFALALLTAGMIFLIGWKAFLLIQFLSLFFAHVAGVWLFYVQHQFEGVYWERNPQWDFVTASILGGSFYKLPGILRWFTGNIGYHHVHHLNSCIPNYKLPKCQKNIPALKLAKPIGLISSLKSLTFRLWDEDSGRLISFREARKKQKYRAAA